MEAKDLTEVKGRLDSWLGASGVDRQVGGNFSIRNNNELRFYDNGNYIGFEAPALSADQIWVLPSVDGNANEALSADGSGTLIWRTHDELASFVANEHMDTTAWAEDLIPDGDNTRDLGATSYNWKDLYLQGNLTDETATLTVANCKTAFDHVTANGSSHTFIDQNVTSGSTPTLTATNITGVPAASILAGSFGTGSYTIDATLTLAGLTATSNLDIGVYTLTSLNFISDVATGTSPYACTSTTLNTNLNADQVDSKDVGTSGSTIPLLDGANSWSGQQTLTQTELMTNATAAMTVNLGAFAFNVSGYTTYGINFDTAGAFGAGVRFISGGSDVGCAELVGTYVGFYQGPGVHVTAGTLSALSLPLVADTTTPVFSPNGFTTIGMMFVYQVTGGTEYRAELHRLGVTTWMSRIHGTNYGNTWTRQHFCVDDTNRFMMEGEAGDTYMRRNSGVIELVLDGNIGLEVVVDGTLGEGIKVNQASSVFSGAGAPAGGGANGDFYLRSGGAGGTALYFKAAGAWGAIA